MYLYHSTEQERTKTATTIKNSLPSESLQSIEDNVHTHTS